MRFRPLASVAASAALLLGVACGAESNEKTVTLTPAREATSTTTTSPAPTTTTARQPVTTTTQRPTTTTTAQPAATTTQRPALTTTTQRPTTTTTRPLITTTTTTTSYLSNDDYYTNVDGDSVHSPAYSSNGQAPAGATAQCRDGTYSFSQNRSGTCSHHGG